MKNKDIFEALGGIDADVVLAAAPEGAKGKKNLRKPRKHGWIKWVVVAACLSLLVTTVFAVSSMFNKGSEDEKVNIGLPTDIDSIIWKDEFTNNDSYGDCKLVQYVTLNGFKVESAVFNAMLKYPEKYIAIKMVRKDEQSIEDGEYSDFVDEGIYAEDKNNTLYLFITKDQLMNLKMENNSDYVLYLADLGEYKNQNVYDLSEYEKDEYEREYGWLDEIIIIK